MLCKASKNVRVFIHNPLAIDVVITEFGNIVVTYYSKCVSALHLISENVKSKILECGPFSGGHFSIHFSNNYIQQTSTLVIALSLKKASILNIVDKDGPSPLRLFVGITIYTFQKQL
jgi:hypothetical protein